MLEIQALAGLPSALDPRPADPPSGRGPSHTHSFSPCECALQSLRPDVRLTLGPGFVQRPTLYLVMEKHQANDTTAASLHVFSLSGAALT